MARVYQLIPWFFCLTSERLLGAEVESDFMTQVRALSAQNQQYFATNQDQALNDQLLEANAEMLSRAEKEKSPIFDFLIANQLFKIDTDSAHRLQSRVIAAYPDEPAANLEWAMVSHLRGQHEVAASAYEKFLKAVPQRETT